VQVVHIEQQDGVRKRVHHPNEVFNNILGNCKITFFSHWIFQLNTFTDGLCPSFSSALMY
jgi:hypothetical protein